MAATILQEGWLQKQSRFTRSWGKLWVVITYNHIIAYRTEEKQETVEMFVGKDLKSIHSCFFDNHDTFYIETSSILNNCIYFKCDDSTKKKQWINNIKILMTCIKIPINVACERHSAYECKFDLNVPYSKEHNYSIAHIIHDIIVFIIFFISSLICNLRI
eukprot:34284_1